MAEEVVTSVIGKVKDLLFGKAKEEISYVWNCSKNVEELKDENKKLTEMKGRVQQKITAAKEKGDTLINGVEGWMAEAEDQISKANEVIHGFEANADKMARRFKSLYHYGKKAAKTATSVLKVQKHGETFESCVSVPARTLREIDVYNKHN